MRDPRLPAFRRVLLAAAATKTDRSRLRAARLLSPRQILRVCSLEEALARLALSDSYACPFPLRASVEALLRVRTLPRHACRVSVWRSLAEKPLSDADRDRLWNRFELPVFEEIRSPAGKLLAWECDLHEGLHIRESVVVAECVAGEMVLTSLADLRWPVLRVRTGRKGELLHSRCECGQEGLHFEATGQGLTLDTSYDMVEDVSRSP